MLHLTSNCKMNKSPFFLFFKTLCPARGRWVTSFVEQMQCKYCILAWAFLCGVAVAWGFEKFKLHLSGGVPRVQSQVLTALFFGIFCSITAFLVARLKEQNEKRLELSQTRLKTELANVESIIEALEHHCILAITDRDGLIQEVNDSFCSLSKYSREELIGVDHRIMNSGFHSPVFFEKLWRTILRGDVWKGEMQIRAKSGELLWLDTTIFPVFNEAGEIQKFICIRSDITERKKNLLDQSNFALTQLKEKQDTVSKLKENTDFLRMIGHELRGPLTPIRMLSEYLSAQTDTPDSMRDMLNTITVAVKDANDLLGELLDFAKMDAGVMNSSKRVNLHSWLAEIIKTNEVLIGSKGLDFQIDLADNLPEFVNFDPLNYRKVLVNLLSNAAKYTHSGYVKLTVTVQSQEGAEGKGCYLVCCVEDSGLGIEPEMREAIFQPFMRIADAQRRKIAGIGLGLSITQKIIERVGGKICVSANPTGQGSIFSVELPYLAASGTDSSDGQTQEHIVVKEDMSKHQENMLKGVKILVVDDEPTICAVLKDCLRYCRSEVSSASGSEEAIEICMTEDFDLVFMDIHMPGRNGIQTAREIIEAISPTGRKIPVFIALTGDTCERLKEECFEIGFQLFIAKPFSLHTLPLEINDLLKK